MCGNQAPHCAPHYWSTSTVSVLFASLFCFWLIFPRVCDWSNLMVSTCWKQTLNPRYSRKDWTLVSVLNNAAFRWASGTGSLLPWVFRSVCWLKSRSKNVHKNSNSTETFRRRWGLEDWFLDLLLHYASAPLPLCPVCTVCISGSALPFLFSHYVWCMHIHAPK